MRYHVIADGDTVLGFKYAGIDGDVVESPQQARRIFQEVVKDQDVGVIIMTDQAAETIGEEVTRTLYESRRPVIVSIPGPEGPSATRRSLAELIREAVGVKI